MTARGRHGSAPLLAPVVLVLIAMLAGAVPPSLSSSPSADVPLGTLGSVSGCAGIAGPTNYTGALRVLGSGASVPSAANVTVDLNYTYLMNYTPRGGNSTLTCVAGASQAVTNASGAIAFAVHLPASSCTGGSCTWYEGPFAPLNLTFPAPIPSGYFASTRVVGDAAEAEWVEALANVTLSPRGPITVSAFDPVTIEANATAANGAPTPADVTYSWGLPGSAWQLLNGSFGPLLKIEPVNSSPTDSLTVWVNGSYLGAPVSVGPASLVVTAVATRVGQVATAPASADVGSGLILRVNGSGAPGYPYTARFTPGLSNPVVTVPCPIVASVASLAEVGCAIDVSYAVAGTAQPSVELSNGYSTSTRAFPAVVVAPSLGLVATPDPAILYSGSGGRLTVSILPGTGSAPYGPACLGLAPGTEECEFTSAENWTFPIAYAAAGAYVVRASVVDASGTNRSTTFPVDVYDRPTLPRLNIASPQIAVGSPLSVQGPLAGGAAPITYWWNDSLPVGTIRSGTTEVVGGLSLSYSSEVPGEHNLTLTVEDALGTVVAARATVVVTPGPAASLDLVADGGGSATAGDPYPLAWRALDALGRAVPSFAEPVLVTRTLEDAPDPAIWLNFSSTSVALTGQAPTFVLPPEAWVLGELNLTLSATGAGNLSLDLSSSVPWNGLAGGRLVIPVLADAHHPRLTGPLESVARPQGRDARYEIADAFGNPIALGYVVVRTVAGGAASEVDSPILFDGRASTVWVNYSIPTGEPGEVFVLSEYGAMLLPPQPVAADLTAYYLLAIVGGAVSAGFLTAVLLVRARRRTRGDGRFGHPEAEESELRRVAEGRALLLSAASRTEGRTLSELEEGCGAIGATHAEAADWTASLVADGSLRAVPGVGGPEHYLLLEPDEAELHRPRIDLDPTALDRARALAEESDLAVTAAPERERPSGERR